MWETASSSHWTADKEVGAPRRSPAGERVADAELRVQRDRGGRSTQDSVRQDRCTGEPRGERVLGAVLNWPARPCGKHEARQNRRQNRGSCGRGSEHRPARSSSQTTACFLLLLNGPFQPTLSRTSSRSEHGGQRDRRAFPVPPAPHVVVTTWTGFPVLCLTSLRHSNYPPALLNLHRSIRPQHPSLCDRQSVSASFG